MVIEEQAALSVKKLTFHYHTRTEMALEDVNLQLFPGQILLLAGASGSGKTTLMRCINGLIPRTYRGDVQGEIRVFGRPVREMSMAQLSQVVGTLLQDPERQIVASFVLNEVAFGLENLGLPRPEILQRVDETLAYLKISHLRDRETFHLSGGEKQKVALAAVLAMRPRILLLDEPLASLDPASAHEALQLFRQLADDGIAIMIVEHRVEDVLSIQPERVAYMDEGKIIYDGDIPGLMEVVDYQRIKLPAPIILQRAVHAPHTDIQPALPPPSLTSLIQFENVSFRYGLETPDVLHKINFSIHPGDVIAILGHNGAGKTTLVKHALGLLKPTEGRVLLDNHDTRKITVAQAAHTVGYVFQSPSQMLFAPSVEEELAFGPRNLEHSPLDIQRDVAWAIETVHLSSELKMPPLALSFGQQKRVSIAAVLAMRSRILMMDEPTAGQDYWNYKAFMDSILQMPGFDAILFITHDLDLALIYANRILLIDGGRIVADGKPEEVLRDENLLRRSRILPTSLLRLNLEYLPRTGRFLRAEALARYA
ncbi:MAG: ABC transporter ATP-binding protein [Anaerolineaceae bacterium]|nr:ABC transporter ATP-binding protein [Anaerolineaceae bacterium]